jgi:hypothetical protein
MVFSPAISSSTDVAGEFSTRNPTVLLPAVFVIPLNRVVS